MDRLWLAPGKLHIEPAEAGDAEAMARIHAASFYRGWPSADFARFLDDKATPAFVACDAKRRIAGFALVRIVMDEAELLTIAVDPKWRGKGVGRALMQALFSDLMMSPAKKLFLEVDAGNDAAIALYKRMGFITLSQRQGYYARPDGSAASALVMACDLG